MTRIDFHSNVPDKIAYVCRLVRKARAQAQPKQIVLLTESQQQLAILDQALWTFSAIDFLPHVCGASPLATQTPVILTDNGEFEAPHYQILINLSTLTPQHFARYERMFEIVSSENADTLAGRSRYSFYKQRGYPLTHFVAENL